MNRLKITLEMEKNSQRGFQFLSPSTYFIKNNFGGKNIDENKIHL